jgi:hypothetical protein
VGSSQQKPAQLLASSVEKLKASAEKLKAAKQQAAAPGPLRPPVLVAAEPDPALRRAKDKARDKAAAAAGGALALALPPLQLRCMAEAAIFACLPSAERSHMPWWRQTTPFPGFQQIPGCSRH